MPAALTASLAESLDGKSALRVREAVDGEEVLPDTVYLAPGGRHMIISQKKAGPAVPASRKIRLTDDPPVNSCRPSADVLFRSLPGAYDGGIMAVIMTGMGNDGREGVRFMKRQACYCLTQTEDSCIVYGMPRAVDDAGLSDERVPLDLMADRIVDLLMSAGKGMQ
jgi:two-component system chemotaxis response regulator CheB